MPVMEWKETAVEQDMKKFDEEETTRFIEQLIVF
jgi:hypothetical protein